MESKLYETIIKIEDSIHQIETIELRIKKADELIKSAGNDEEKIRRFVLARGVFTDQIKEIIERTHPHVRELEEKREKLEAMIEKLEDERLTKQGLYEIELALKK